MNEDELRKAAWLAIVKWLDAWHGFDKQQVHTQIANHTLDLLATAVGLRKNDV